MAPASPFFLKASIPRTIVGADRSLLFCLNCEGVVLLKSWTFYALCIILAGCHPPESQKDVHQKSAPLASLLKDTAPGSSEDILLITIDTWRHDASSFSGNAQASTPTIDQLAAQGVIFDAAYAHATVTLPSHTSILTGLLPYHHGLRDNAGYRLAEQVKTLPGRLRARGYTTGAFISAFPLDSRYGLAKDFDLYDDLIDRYADPLAKVTERPGAETIANAMAWMAEATDKPKFTWIHIYEPHYPYEPPEPFKSRFQEHPYLGEVAYCDHLLEPLLKPYLNGEKQATILLTSDHGEGLGDHGEATHGLFAYEATLKVPLVLWSPGKLSPGKITAPVGHVDIAPTLLELESMPSQLDFDGRSLLSHPPTPAIYFESLSTYINRGWAPLRGCIQDRYKAIDLPIPELYNLAADPTESQNLAGKNSDHLKSCLACLPNELPNTSNRQALSDEEREKLASLGYTASSGGEDQGDFSKRDPKNLIEVDHLIYQAFGLAGKGQFQLASDQLVELIQKHPEVELAYQYASDYAYQLGQVARAIGILDQARQRGIAGELSLRKLALYLIQIGRYDAAQDVLTPLNDSQDPETYATFGKLYTRQGQFELAAQSFQKALSLDQTNPSVWAELGTMHLYAKALEPARQAFEKALTQNDREAEAWNGLGVVRIQSGQPGEAIQAWEKAVAINPKLAFAHRNLALANERIGDLEKARYHWRAFAGLVEGEQRERALAQLDRLK